MTPCLRSGAFEKAFFDQYPAVTNGTAMDFPTIAAATAAGKAGDYAADGSGYTSSGSITEYVKGYTATGAGVAGKGAFITRDNAYDAWVLKINDTADAQVNEDKAYVQHRILLKRAYAQWTWTTEDLVGNPAVDVVRASSASDYATYINASDNLKIQTAEMGAAWSLSTAKARSGTMQYFPQLFRTINECYNDVITKTLALGKGSAVSSSTQVQLTSAQLDARGAAGLTQAVVTAASGLTKDYLTAALAANVATADKTQATADKDRAVTAQTLAKNNLKTA